MATSASIVHYADGGKNRNAVALGALGGKKGGPARARRLSPERRTEIAKQGGRARQKQKRST